MDIKIDSGKKISISEVAQYGAALLNAAEKYNADKKEISPETQFYLEKLDAIEELMAAFWLDGNADLSREIIDLINEIDPPDDSITHAVNSLIKFLKAEK